MLQSAFVAAITFLSSINQPQSVMDWVDIILLLSTPIVLFWSDVPIVWYFQGEPGLRVNGRSTAKALAGRPESRHAKT